MTTNYIALIRKDKDSDYGVEFPDFPGCMSAGVTLDIARESAAEALALHVEGMLEDGESIPTPSSLETVMEDIENRDTVAILVPGPDTRVPHKRINVTLPEDLIDAIDAASSNRSGFLADAAREKLQTTRADASR